MYAAPTSVLSPMIAAPSMAPYAWPGPPRKTAARMSTRNRSVLVAPKLPASMAKIEPAMPHSAPEIAQVTVTTWSVRMPELRARDGFAAVALIGFAQPAVAQQGVHRRHDHQSQAQDHELHEREPKAAETDVRPLVEPVGDTVGAHDRLQTELEDQGLSLIH